MKLKRTVLSLFSILVFGLGVFVTTPAKAQFFFDVLRYVSADDLDNQYRTLFLPESWKFSSDDNPDFAHSDFDDWDWLSLSTALEPAVMEAIDWHGSGWFRLALDVDSSLIGQPLAVEVLSISGSAEVFMNGKQLFALNNGRTSALKPSSQSHVLTFSEPGRNVIAIRYENPVADWFLMRNLPSGLRIALVDANFFKEKYTEQLRDISLTQFFFSGTLFVFTLLHLLLFFYYRKQTENLFFALFTLNFALFVIVSQQEQLIYDLASKVWLTQALEIVRSLAMVFFMRFVYELLTPKVSEIRFGVVTLAIAGYLTWSLVGLPHRLLYLDILYILLATESLWLLGKALYEKREGAAIFGVGLTIFVFANVFNIIVNYDLVSVSQEMLGIIGMGALLVAMSVSLSRNFALTNNRLQANLIAVQRLSDEALEKERRIKKEELEKQLLAADNARKTSELEEARKLQISLLPKMLPKLAGYDIAAEMVPASEVGGDYYDYVTTPDATILTLGDATGHGVKAGIIVATAKSFFHTHASQCDNVTLLHKMSQAVKNMDVHMMYMGLTILRVQENTIDITAAGMPPLIYYDAKSGKTDLITLKGMPLGSVTNFPYQSQRISMKTGDILLALSDGLPELFNEEKHMYDYHRAQALLSQYAAMNSTEIKQKILADAHKWTSGKGNQDDITLMILKKE